jgi:HEAT repeat protein
MTAEQILAAARVVSTSSGGGSPDRTARLAAAEALLGSDESDGKLLAEAVEVLCGWAAGEGDPQVLRVLEAALGTRLDRLPLPRVLDAARHPAAPVRRAAAFALERVPGGAGPRGTEPAGDEGEGAAAVAELIGLSSDGDEPVRTLAVRALAVSAIDSPTVRDALAARLGEAGPVRLEALRGLALRQDARARGGLRALADEVDAVHGAGGASSGRSGAGP